MAVPPDASADAADIEDFLDVEESAHRLAESLAALEVSVEGYREAASEISGVTEATTQLAEGVSGVGARTAEALDVLVAMGGPHIMKKLEYLGERMAALESRVIESVELGTNNKAMLSAQAAEVSDLKVSLASVKLAQTRVLLIAGLAAAAALATLVVAILGMQ